MHCIVLKILQKVLKMQVLNYKLIFLLGPQFRDVVRQRAASGRRPRQRRLPGRQRGAARRLRLAEGQVHTGMGKKGLSGHKIKAKEKKKKIFFLYYVKI